jgi:serine protease Do
MPAVVSVNNNYTAIYGDYFGQTLSDEAQAVGSGIIVGKNETELLIVTNDHVVMDEYDSSTFEVIFVDGSVASAQVKGRKAEMDLAVLAVKLSDIGSETLNSIAIAKLGDSDALAVGEPAIAIGNAMGYGQSVTTGVISALDRESTYSTGVAEVSSTFIQTDAAINPGNSGGALLNIKGEVIGINSNKVGGSLIEGMGYAIPISMAKPIIGELMMMETRDRVAEDERGYMGITGGLTMMDEYVENYNLPKGVYITQVTPGTPAEEAGLRKGDIIIEIDGVEVLGWNELQSLMGYYAVGDVIELTIMRGDAMGGYEEQTVTLELGPLPSIDNSGSGSYEQEVQPETLPGDITEDFWNGFFD